MKKSLKKLSIYGIVLGILLLIVGCSGGSKKASEDSSETKSESGEKFSGKITVGEEIDSGKYDIKYTDDEEDVTIYIYDSADDVIDTLSLAKENDSKFVTKKQVVESYILKKGYKLSIDGTAEFILVKEMDITDSSAGEESEAESSSSSTAETETSSTTEAKVEKTEKKDSSSDVADAIKKVDKKYDDMIKKAQGYVDNPDSYNSAASLSFLSDYTELMTEYAKLGETIEASGDDLGASDALTIYSNLVTKSLELTELYGKLG